jgi:hypothetical protein
MSQPSPSTPQATPAPARPVPRRRSAAAALAALAALALAATSPLLPLASQSETNATPAALAKSPSANPGTNTLASESPASPGAAESATDSPPASLDPKSAMAEGTNTSDSSTSDSAASRSDRESRRSSRRSASGTSDRRSDDRSSRRSDRSSGSEGDTNAPVSAQGTDFASFKIIGERNIFNPNRGRASARTDREPTRKPTQIDHFSLVGTMSYAKGDFAFFDGSSATYRKTLKCGDAIAGYTVKAISANAVQLASGETPVEMTLGSQLRREDEGEWKFIARTEASGSSSSSLSGSSSSSRGDRSAPAGDSAGAANDILLKLMKKREQEK